MMMRNDPLSQHPHVFQKYTGLTVDVFDQQVDEVLPLSVETEQERSNRRAAISRQHREPCAGSEFRFSVKQRQAPRIVIAGRNEMR